MNVRPERPADAPEIRALLAEAFDTEAEAGLVDAIRASGAPCIALVAEDESGIAGHIFFSEAWVGGAVVAALAPMAVTPRRQRQGIGKALVEAGLEACRRAGYPGVVVLGHPEYYPKFGFTPARARGIECPYDAPDAAWMALELEPGALHDITGLVQYHEAFGQLPS